MYDIIIIGGGAAGIMAAYEASKYDKKILIIDKNKKLGAKWRITGNGKCNITYIGDNSTLMENMFVNARFMYPAINRFSNDDILDLLSNNGVPVKEDHGKMFPVSEDANEVVDFFCDKLQKNKNVEIIDDRVSEIIVDDGIVRGVQLENGHVIRSKKVILATGGKSYPTTGSTGDGYDLAKSVGHKVITPKPSLVAIKVDKTNDYETLNGVSLREVKFSLFENHKVIAKEEGDAVFTYAGLSGPGVFKTSNHMINGREYDLQIDLLPDVQYEDLKAKLLKLMDENKNKSIYNVLNNLIIKKLAQYILKVGDIDSNKQVNSITVRERKLILHSIKEFVLRKARLMDIKYATITAGGVDTKEINPKTMESKKIKGLYFAGEVIDVHANTGGFNLQIAYSTGVVAGENAASN